MVNLDQRFITKEINYYGNTVTIRSVSSSCANSKWGDHTENTIDTPNIKCAVYTISAEDIYYRESGFQVGDLIFFFDSTKSQYMNTGNRILYDNKWYQITNIKTWRVADMLLSFEVYTKKI